VEGHDKIFFSVFTQLLLWTGAPPPTFKFVPAPLVSFEYCSTECWWSTLWMCEVTWHYDAAKWRHVRRQLCQWKTKRSRNLPVRPYSVVFVVVGNWGMTDCSTTNIGWGVCSISNPQQRVCVSAQIWSVRVCAVNSFCPVYLSSLITLILPSTPLASMCLTSCVLSLHWLARRAYDLLTSNYPCQHWYWDPFLDL